MALSTPFEPFEFSSHVGWPAGADLAAGLWRSGHAVASLMAARPRYFTPIFHALPVGRVLIECAHGPPVTSRGDPALDFRRILVQHQPGGRSWLPQANCSTRSSTRSATAIGTQPTSCGRITVRKTRLGPVAP